MALIENDDKFYMSSDYSSSEPSIKSAISYFIGMLSAYAIAEKEYKIPYLYHLKDPVISRIVNPSKYFPDFFGLGYGSINDAYLIEAKGSWKDSISNESIFKAKKQLKSIGQLIFNDSSGNYHYITRFRRHITGSYFQDDELKFCDVDPESVGNLEYYFDANLAIQAYYQNIMLLLQSGESHVRVVNGIKYHLVDFEGYTVGLNEFVFNKLQNRSEITGLYDSIYRRVVETYDSNIEFLKEESISLGRDGIIVL